MQPTTVAEKEADRMITDNEIADALAIKFRDAGFDIDPGAATCEQLMDILKDVEFIYTTPNLHTDSPTDLREVRTTLWDRLTESLSVFRYRLRVRILRRPSIRAALAIYELDSIGVNGALEAVAVYHFCSEDCRQAFRRTLWEPTSLGVSSDFIDGTVCDKCGAAL
jgi:hypothetical protein